jgi:hypothetical protein
VFNILTKKKSAFFTCPETLNEAELKRNGLINLTEDVSRPHSIQFMAWLLPLYWLLLVDLQQASQGEKQSERFLQLRF